MHILLNIYFFVSNDVPFVIQENHKFMLFRLDLGSFMTHVVLTLFALGFSLNELLCPLHLPLLNGLDIDIIYKLLGSSWLRLPSLITTFLP